MKTLLADANVEGHVERLVKRMQGEAWIEYWQYLQLELVRFHDVGLAADDTDAVVWNRCQEKKLFLLTNNRNNDGPDSLEETIRHFNTDDSLPVFTIGDADRTLRDREYS